MDECKRKECRSQHGQPPVSDMLASGQMLPKEHK